MAIGIDGLPLKVEDLVRLRAMNEKNVTSKSSCIEVISLGVKDLNACKELDEDALQGLWSKEQWRKELTGSNRLCIGITNSSKLIGLSCGWLVIDELHLTTVAIHPKHRRKGHARTLLKALFNEAQKRGATRATLEVEIRNLAAISLYKRLGFITAGKRKNYYSNGQDALIQWVKLTPFSPQRR